MPLGMTEDEYIALLAKRAQEPRIQALVASWPPLTPDQIALFARIFGGTKHAATTRDAA